MLQICYRRLAPCLFRESICLVPIFRSHPEVLTTCFKAPPQLRRPLVLYRSSTFRLRWKVLPLNCQFSSLPEGPPLVEMIKRGEHCKRDSWRTRAENGRNYCTVYRRSKKLCTDGRMRGDFDGLFSRAHVTGKQRRLSR